jgi:hypothetical protein
MNLKLKTWYFETFFVALVLFLIIFFTKNVWREYVGGLAVLLSFGHGSIAERFREKEEKKNNPDVACFQYSLYYFIGKELCWLCYFIATKSYSALVGVVIFLVYPFWRKFWRYIHPIDIS